MLRFLILVAFLIAISSAAFHLHPLNVNGLSDYGAEITGVDLETIDDHTFDLIHHALLQYKVIVIRNQPSFTIEGQRIFTKRLGHLHIHLESSSHYPGYPDVNVVSNIKNASGHYIGLYGAHVENYHSDLSWTDIPTKITVLKSVIRPDQCGDTEFANSHAAYDRLPELVKERVKGLKANYCYLKLRELNTQGSAENLNSAEVAKAHKCAIHPLITTHPITGRKNIYANPSHTRDIIGVTPEESEEILNFLFKFVDQPQFRYRHHYEDNDVVLWDNRAVHHRATGCPDEFPRKLVRTTVSNDAEPEEELVVDRPFNLSADRVNAEYPPRPTPPTPILTTHSDL